MPDGTVTRVTCSDSGASASKVRCGRPGGDRRRGRALKLRRPVKWIEDRRDALTAAFLAREQRYDARAPSMRTAAILALDVTIVCDMAPTPATRSPPALSR